MTVPPDRRAAEGREAEEAACRFLSGRGMEILRRNVRTGGGEIDVVAREGSAIVFVEVRSRAAEDFGTPEETVGRGKRMRVVRAARAFLAGMPGLSWEEARFDVVAVLGRGDSRVIRHYPGAFDAKGKIL